MKEQSNQRYEINSSLSDDNVEANSKKNYGEMPNDILKTIFSLLQAHDLARVAAVCKKWNELSSSNELWKKECEKFGISSKKDSFNNIKGYYKGLFNEYAKLDSYSYHNKKTYFIASKREEEPTWGRTISLGLWPDKIYMNKEDAIKRYQQPVEPLEFKYYLVIYEVKLSNHELKRLKVKKSKTEDKVDYLEVPHPDFADRNAFWDAVENPVRVTITNTYYKFVMDWDKPFLSIRHARIREDSKNETKKDSSLCLIS